MQLQFNAVKLVAPQVYISAIVNIIAGCMTLPSKKIPLVRGSIQE